MDNTPDSPAKTPDGCTPRGGNYWTLFTPEIWKVLHAVSHVKHVRIALATLYRDARIGKVSTQDAARLGYLLNLIRVCIVDGEMEARLAALENHLEETP